MSKAALILISVVVPTFNRRQYLPQLVESLSSQTLPADQFEVIVVDNSSTDATDELMREFVRTVSFRLVYHRNPVNLGVSKSRNIGACLARAPLLAYTDSDCKAAPEWLEQGLKAMEENPQAAFVTGTVINKPDVPSRFFSIGESAIHSENPFFPTCNIIYRRKIFFEMGGFDEKLYFFDTFALPVECGDVDLGWRVKEAGYQTVFAPAALMYHEIRIVPPVEWLVCQIRAMSVPKMVRLHAGFRKQCMWWGPFCLRDNLLFYLAGAGVLLAITVNAWFFLLALAYIVRLVRIANPRLSTSGFLMLLPKLIFLTARQTVICTSLIYGSIRERCLVL